MIAIGYNVFDYTLPDGMDVVRFRQQLARAMRYIEKSSAGNVRFLHRGLELQKGNVKPVSCARFVNIGFENLPATSGAGEWSRLEANSGLVDSIAFASNAKWSRGWWDKVLSFKPDLYTVAIHELGHLLGLPHNEESESVMSTGARFSTFSPREIHHLQTMQP